MDLGEILAWVFGLGIGLSIGWLMWLLNAPSRERFAVQRKALQAAQDRISTLERQNLKASRGVMVGVGGDGVGLDEGQIIDFPSRHDRERLVAERDEAREEAERAHNGRDAAERRLAAVRQSLAALRAQLEATASREDVIDLRDGHDVVATPPAHTVHPLPSHRSPSESLPSESLPSESLPSEFAAPPKRPPHERSQLGRDELAGTVASLEDDVIRLRRRVADQAVTIDRLRTARSRDLDAELERTLARLGELRQAIESLDPS